MSEKKEKVKKPLHKRWWFWVIAILVVGSWIVNDDDKESAEEKVETIDKQEDSKADEKKEKEAEKAAKEDKEKEEAKKKEEEEKERKANRTTAEAIEEDSNNVDEASIDGDELVLKHNPGTVWSENSFMHTVYDMFKDVKTAFDDEEIKSVLVMIETTMTDEKGNESVDPIITYRYTREDFEELNYDNFSNMAMSEEWRILNEADSYFIHPGIRMNLKDKYIQNLR